MGISKNIVISISFVKNHGNAWIQEFSAISRTLSLKSFTKMGKNLIFKRTHVKNKKHHFSKERSKPRIVTISICTKTLPNQKTVPMRETMRANTHGTFQYIWLTRHSEFEHKYAIHFISLPPHIVKKNMLEIPCLVALKGCAISDKWDCWMVQCDDVRWVETRMKNWW